MVFGAPVFSHRSDQSNRQAIFFRNSFGWEYDWRSQSSVCLRQHHAIFTAIAIFCFKSFGRSDTNSRLLHLKLRLHFTSHTGNRESLGYEKINYTYYFVRWKLARQ